MNPGRGLIVSIFLIVLLLFLPAQGHVAVIADLADFFKPVEGTLIAIQGEDYLLNLDASAGAMVGDLFSIVVPGEQLTDPDSGAVLGSLDRVKGVLKITRVRSGFSHARPLGDILQAQKGDRVRRFQNLTAIFQDEKGAGFDLYRQLVSALPALEWQGYYPGPPTTANLSSGSGEPAQLVFSLTHASMRVQDSAGQLLRSFSVEEQAFQPAQLPVQPSIMPAKTVTPPVEKTAAIPKMAPAQVSYEKPKQVAYSVDYPGYKTLGEFPGIVLTADFSAAGGQLLIAGSNGDDLNIFEVSERMTLVASGKKMQQGKVHAVAWWRPEITGPLYLAVTASEERSFANSTSAEVVFTSTVYRYTNGQLTAVVQNLPYLLGTFDRDSDGAKETLLAQRFDLDTVHGTVRELKLAGGRLRESSTGIKLPLSFPVQGSAFADLTGDGKTETVYTRKGILYIINNGRLEYESAKQMGGSLSRLTYDVNPGQADALFSSVAFEVPQVAADIDGDGQLELVAVSADRSAFSAPGLDSGVGESWLSVIKYQNGRFVKGTLGEKLEKPIQGLMVHQGQALIVLSRQDSILNGQGQSYLLALPLAP